MLANFAAPNPPARFQPVQRQLADNNDNNDNQEEKSLSFRTWRAAGALGTAALLAACAAPVPVTSAALTPLATSIAATDMLIGEEVPIRLSTGYTRTIPPQSRWRAVGRLPQGVVYQPVGTVFAIEGRQVHEAYLVLQSTSLQGFYLPAEANYSPLAQPLTLPITQGAPK